MISLLSRLSFLVALLWSTCTVYADQNAGEQQSSDRSAADVESQRELAESEFTVTANGQIKLDAAKHSPIYAEFEGSPVLTQRLRGALKDLGLAVSEDRSGAKAALTFKGDLVLIGGPKFYKGAKVSVGDVTERAIKESNGQIRTVDVVSGAEGLALNRAAYSGAMRNFTRGLAIGGMVNALGDLGGAKGWFNKTLTGDPRGICLHRCEDWNKVKQTVYLSTELESEGKKDEVKIITKVFSETVVPDQVVKVGVSKAIERIQVSNSPVDAQSVGLAQVQK